MDEIEGCKANPEHPHEDQWTDDGFGPLCAKCLKLIVEKGVGNRQERRREAAMKRRKK